MSVLGEFYDFLTWVKKFSEKKQNAPPEPEGALHFGCSYVMNLFQLYFAPAAIP